MENKYMTLTKYSNPDRGTDQRKTGNKTWQVGELWDLHHEIMRYLLLGFNNTEIAEKVGVTPEHVSSIRNSRVVEDRMALLQAARDADTIDVARDIRNMAPESLSLLKSVIRGEQKDATIGLRVKVAESNLSRSGYDPPKRFQGELAVAHLTGEDIEELKNRARQNNQLAQAN